MITVPQMEKKLEQGQDDFEKISKNIRVEMKRFEVQRVRDFKTTIVHYLEGLMNTQQQVRNCSSHHTVIYA
jgi:sorting nexin-1/2